MNAFVANTQVTLPISIADDDGNPLQAKSAEFSVSDQTGAVIIERTAVDASQISEDGSTVTVVIPADKNGLAAPTASEYRSVTVYCVVASNTLLFGAGYTIEPAERLIVGVNSFQTTSQAELTASTMPNIVAWSKATPRQRSNALMDARNHIVQLSFNQLNSNINWGQDSLNFVPEGNYTTSYVSTNGLFLFNGNLALLSPAQFAKLPEKFLQALRFAQVAEAEFILGGDSIGNMRRDGVMLESIGDVKQMFRPSKPLEMPVCKRALSYLAYFVTFSKKIGRI